MSSVLGQYQHHAALEYDAFEALLPLQYKNPFLRTPRVRAVLAKASWLGPGEQLVIITNSNKPIFYSIFFLSKLIVLFWFIFRCMIEIQRK